MPSKLRDSMKLSASVSSYLPAWRCVVAVAPQIRKGCWVDNYTHKSSDSRLFVKPIFILPAGVQLCGPLIIFARERFKLQIVFSHIVFYCFCRLFIFSHTYLSLRWFLFALIFWLASGSNERTSLVRVASVKLYLVFRKMDNNLILRSQKHKKRNLSQNHAL